MTNLRRWIVGLLIPMAIGVSAPAAAQKGEAAALSARAMQLYQVGKYSEATRLAERALAIGEKSFGPSHPAVATLINNVASFYETQGRYAEAELLFKRSLAIAEKANGPNHPDIAMALNNLGVLYVDQGRYAEAEPLFKRALAVHEKALGHDNSVVATDLNNLAKLYTEQNRYAEAELLYSRSLAIREKALGSSHPDVSQSLNNLAELYRNRGRYADAEPLYKRSLAIFEKALGPSHFNVAAALNNLGELYHDQGRYADAEPLYKRSLTIVEMVLGPGHPVVASSLNNLASVYESMGRYADAEPLYLRSLSIREKALGPDHANVATSLNNLAGLYQSNRRSADAELLYRRSLAIYERALGSDHPNVAKALNNLAHLYRSEGRYADAEPLYQRSLAINEKGLGPNHPGVALSLNNLAAAYRDQRRYADALPMAQRVVTGGTATPRVILPVLMGAQRENLISTEKALDDSLNVVQRASQTSAAAAVDKLAVRFAAGSDRLAQLVRRDQDLASEADALDKAIVAAVSKEPSKRDPIVEQRTKERLATVAGERATLQKIFSAEFPDYAALSNPLPVAAKEIQALLSPDEALVLFSTSGNNESYVFSLTREQAEWKSIPLGADALSQKVAAFRRGLDIEELAGTGKTALFDLGLANELYAALLGPVEMLLNDKKQLLVVPSGALTALPFHLLVTERPVAAVPEKFEGYRDAAWLIKRQAISVLPSVASLKALRAFARTDHGSKPMIGFGDPVFDPDYDTSNTRVAAAKPGTTKSAVRSLTNAPYTEFWQGAGIDRSKLAQALPQLPDTADELKAVALKLGAPASDIHLGLDASETTLKRAPLADYGIVYFATHGLVAGDVKGLAEPSLALSIPTQPTELDDGLLTASEVAQLKLNADWVVLSACNTIAGDKPGAEALSGLARSFFYAGARALLVSHWAVDSAAATRLTISTFENLKSDPGIGRAEALRRAMLGYLNDASSSQNAYPAFWGPFALIGEGTAR